MNRLIDLAIYRYRIPGFYAMVLAFEPEDDAELKNIIRTLVYIAKVLSISRGEK